MITEKRVHDIVLVSMENNWGAIRAHTEVIRTVIELIVRDVDEKGRITGLGLSFEPTAPVARVPVFLSAGEIADRVVAFIRNWRKPAKTQGAENEPNGAVAPEPVAQKATTES